MFVDGNNVMGSRPNGWWRDRAGAARRIVAEIALLAHNRKGVWTIVFDGPGPRGTEPSPEHLTVIHAGHGGRDSADDRIVELVGALPDRSMALVYTSDAAFRARLHAMGAQVVGARAYDAEWIRTMIEAQDAVAIIPDRSNVKAQSTRIFNR